MASLCMIFCMASSSEMAALVGTRAPLTTFVGGFGGSDGRAMGLTAGGAGGACGSDSSGSYSESSSLPGAGAAGARWALSGSYSSSEVSDAASPPDGESGAACELDGGVAPSVGAGASCGTASALCNATGVTSILNEVRGCVRSHFSFFCCERPSPAGKQRGKEERRSWRRTKQVQAGHGRRTARSETVSSGALPPSNPTSVYAAVHPPTHELTNGPPRREAS